MKAENAVRLSDNLVGFEVYTIQDVVKAQAAGLELINKDGIGYDYSVVIEDEDGEDAEREPTEQEVFERITKDLAEGDEVYACMGIADGLVSAGKCSHHNAHQLLCRSEGLSYA